MKTILAVLALTLTAGCLELPHAGDPCDVDSCDYENPGVGLFCLEGSYKSIPCAGGCEYTHKGITCDPRGSAPGTICPPALGGMTTCGGNREVMTCFGGIWQTGKTCEPAPGDQFAACNVNADGVNASCVSL